MGEWPALRGTLAEAAAGEAQTPGRIFRGDVRSANWDGGGDLSGGSDSTATAGYLGDYSSGSWQFQNIFAKGGELTTLSILGNLTLGAGGLIRSAASGLRFELGVTGTYAKMDFYTGDGDETAAGFLRQLTGAGAHVMLLQAPTFGSDTSGLLLQAPTEAKLSWDNAVDNASVSVASGGITLQHKTQSILYWVETAGKQHTFAEGGVADAAQGSVAAPLITVPNDLDTGVLWPSADQLGFAAGGALSMGISTTSLFMGIAATGNALMPVAVGSVTDPAYSYVGDTGSGGYRVAAGQLGWATVGVARMSLNATRLDVDSTFLQLPVKADTGDPASPANGDTYVNTFDNTARVYADGAWRDLATW